MKKAFTLAEVLITLGITGVVAAMTIPTLISNTNGHKYRSKFKKTISTLSQAARMSDAQYGFDYAGISSKCGNTPATEHPESKMSVCALLNGTLTGITYYNTVTDLKVKKGTTSIDYSITGDAFFKKDYAARTMDNYQAYTLSDGTLVGISKEMGASTCSLDIGTTIPEVEESTEKFMHACTGFIDVNGTDLPNKEISCSSGTNTLTSNTCVVKNDAQHMTDVFPIRFHDGIVEPATAAGRYVLRTSK